jgi:hypothetical protein
MHRTGSGNENGGGAGCAAGCACGGHSLHNRGIAMRTCSALFAVIALCVAVSQAAGEETWNFEDAEEDALPSGWSSAKTGKGEGSVWRVLDDDSAPGGSKVLAQTSSDGPNPLFNLCVADETSYTDLDLTVSFKAVGGRIDQGGGPVWRYQDRNNYYIARMNPLENNFRLYKVVTGRRTQLATADVEAPAGEWHAIRIVHQEDHIQCYLDDELHLDVRDDTFQEAGKIGLWTKADAVTSFDALSVAEPSN